MTKKKIPMNEKVKTRKDEIRFKTDDPKRMLNKYICSRVIKTWTEDFVDKDTGHITPVQRSEVLFEKGTYINSEVLQRIQFYQAAEECKEIEVSNQNRGAYELESTCLHPYSTKVTIGFDRTYRFILYASSIANVLEIMCDYLELNYSGGFSITNVQEMNSCIILTDELTKENLDIAYLRDGIDMETYIHASAEGVGEDEENTKEKKFFQMDMKITYDDGVELQQQFIVNTFDTNRALLVIGKYLQDAEKRHAEKAKEKGGNYEIRKNVLCIEKAAPMPVKSFVPKDFSLAYNEQE